MLNRSPADTLYILTYWCRLTYLATFGAYIFRAQFSLQHNSLNIVTMKININVKQVSNDTTLLNISLRHKSAFWCLSHGDVDL